MHDALAEQTLERAVHQFRTYHAGPRDRAVDRHHFADARRGDIANPVLHLHVVKGDPELFDVGAIGNAQERRHAPLNEVLDTASQERLKSTHAPKLEILTLIFKQREKQRKKERT